MGMAMVHLTSTSYPKGAAPVSHIQSPFRQSELTSAKLLSCHDIYRQHHKPIRCIVSLLRQICLDGVQNTVYLWKGLHVVRSVNVALSCAHIFVSHAHYKCNQTYHLLINHWYCGHSQHKTAERAQRQSAYVEGQVLVCHVLWRLCQRSLQLLCRCVVWSVWHPPLHK